MPLGAEQDVWCASVEGIGAVAAAALRLDIDAAAIEARAAAIVSARGEAADPAAFEAVRRTDRDWILACRAASEAAH